MQACSSTCWSKKKMVFPSLSPLLFSKKIKLLDYRPFDCARHKMVQNPIVLGSFEVKCKWIKKTNVLNWSGISIVCYYLIEWNGYDCSSKLPDVCETSAAGLATPQNPNKPIDWKKPTHRSHTRHKLVQIFLPCLFLFLGKENQSKEINFAQG